MCGLRAAQRSYYWCGSGAYYWRCYAAIIGAATQLLSALLRSSYRRCYAALIGAATQLLSALLRSYYRRCYAAILALLPRADQQGAAAREGEGVRLRRPCREEHEEKDTENANEMCLCFQSSRL